MSTQVLAPSPDGSGLWGHSSPLGQRSYVIFCVGQEPRIVAAFRAWASAHSIPFKSLKGCYNGQMEDSFIVPLSEFRKVKHWTEQEESILVLGCCDARDRRPAVLIFGDGTKQTLGLFHSCSKEEALSQNAWTYDPAQDAYFVCSLARQETELSPDIALEIPPALSYAAGERGHG